VSWNRTDAHTPADALSDPPLPKPSPVDDAEPSGELEFLVV